MMEGNTEFMEAIRLKQDLGEILVTLGYTQADASEVRVCSLQEVGCSRNN